MFLPRRVISRPEVGTLNQFSEMIWKKYYSAVSLPRKVYSSLMSLTTTSGRSRDFALSSAISIQAKPSALLVDGGGIDSLERVNSCPFTTRPTPSPRHWTLSHARSMIVREPQRWPGRATAAYTGHGRDPLASMISSHCPDGRGYYEGLPAAPRFGGSKTLEPAKVP